MTTNDSSEVVQLQGVTRTYAQGKLSVTAVDDLDLTIRSGDFAVLCGPSGSGKTTILNMMGLLDVPTAGVVKFEGTAVSSLSRTELARLRRDRIGFIFQAYNLIPVLTALENAEFVLDLQGMAAAARRARVMEVLEAVGLAGLENRRPDELSGGQQQRVAIARAIAAGPAVVLADEPTANVDSETGARILDLMERLNREQGVTFVFSSHDPAVIDRARRVLRLRDGKLEHDEVRAP
jgi:putative ABC transport system ATP-binding protein